MAKLVTEMLVRDERQLTHGAGQSIGQIVDETLRGMLAHEGHEPHRIEVTLDQDDLEYLKQPSQSKAQAKSKSKPETVSRY